MGKASQYVQTEDQKGASTKELESHTEKLREFESLKLELENRLDTQKTEINSLKKSQ